MSTTVIRPGSAPAPGPSSRLVGVVIAGLALAIALGFVFANNQASNEAESVAVVTPSATSDQVWQSKIDFLAEQYRTRMANLPSTNIELYRLQTAGLVGQGEAYVPSIVSVIPDTFSPELARAQAINNSRLQQVWDQRYQDLIDRFEHMTVAKPSTAALTGLVPVLDTFSPELARAQAINHSRLQAMWEQRYDDMVEQYAHLPVARPSTAALTGLVPVRDTFSPELARAQAINNSRLQQVWDQRYQDLIDRFEHMTVARPSVASLTGLVPTVQSVPQGYSNLMAEFAARIAAAERARWPQGFKDLMAQFEDRIAEANTVEVDLPRENRGIGH